MIIKEIRKFANEKGYATKKNCYDNSCLWYEDCRKTFKNKKSHE